MTKGWRGLAADMLTQAIEQARCSRLPADGYGRSRRVREAYHARRWLLGAAAPVPACRCCAITGIDHDALISRLRRMGVLDPLPDDLVVRLLALPLTLRHWRGEPETFVRLLGHRWPRSAGARQMLLRELSVLARLVGPDGIRLQRYQTTKGKLRLRYRYAPPARQRQAA